MIDVWGVLANLLWIAGLALLLAAFSWANWVATSTGGRLRVALARPSMRWLLNGGLGLVCGGIIATWIVQVF